MKKDHVNGLDSECKEILGIIKKYDLLQDWNDDEEFNLERYVEVNIWSDEKHIDGRYALAVQNEYQPSFYKEDG